MGTMKLFKRKRRKVKDKYAEDLSIPATPEEVARAVLTGGAARRPDSRTRYSRRAPKQESDS